MQHLIIAIFITAVNTISAFSAIGFTPELSSSCSSALSSLSTILQPNGGCGSILSNVTMNTTQFSVCSTGVGGVNCFDINSVIEAAQTSKYLVPVYRLPTNLTACPLCTTSSGMRPSCSTLLASLVDAVYGVAIDYSSLYGISDTTTAEAAASAVQSNCSSFNDQASVQVLRYQSQVVCNAQDTLNKTISSAGNIDGILDMRSLMQCGTCAVLPCFPGQLCSGDGQAIMCPEGYYCPTTAEKVECPENHFCPQGSTAPISCNGNAGNTCPKGAGRAVVWIPLLISLLMLSMIYGSPVVVQLVHHRTHPTTTLDKPSSRMFKRINISKDEMDFSTVSSPVSIQFDNVRLVTKGTVRIASATGTIRPGRFTAIIGGSGAGKTSLMNCILDREHKTSGEISFLSNDYSGKIPKKVLDRIVAFVPQNDVYLREMTVYELVLHSARWRLPSSLSDQQILSRVDEVLSQLQLSHLKDMQVGGNGTKESISLSPGDKKKVNIALELVAGPNVIFFDEPTSGIDSSSALNVAEIIQDLAKTGLTCAAVIHQPRAEIFDLIDDMIILIRGGLVAYQGPTKHVMEYFGVYGLKPAHDRANKTDFLIDMVSKPPPSHLMSLSSSSTTPVKPVFSTPAAGQGDHAESVVILGQAVHEGKNDNEEEGSPPPPKVTWADLWERDGPAFLASIEQSNTSTAEEQQGQVAHDVPGSEPSASARLRQGNMSTVEYAAMSNKTFVPLDVPRPGFLQQLMLTGYRGFLQHLKNGIYWNDLIAHFLGGIIMGVATCGGPLLVGLIPAIYQGSCPPGAEVKCDIWIRFEVAPATFLLCMVLGSITIPIAVRTFGREKEVFAREAAVGASKLAYYLGKSFADFPFATLNVFMYLTPVLAIAPWQAPPQKMYAVMLCISYAVTSLGYGLSLLFQDPDDAVLTGVIFAILLNLFSGFVPKIGNGPIGTIMYTHWAARAFTAAELIDGQKISVSDFNQIVPSEWQNPSFARDCGAIVLIGVLIQVVAVGLLFYRNWK